MYHLNSALYFISAPRIQLPLSPFSSHEFPSSSVKHVNVPVSTHSKLRLDALYALHLAPRILPSPFTTHELSSLFTFKLLLDAQHTLYKQTRSIFNVIRNSRHEVHSSCDIFCPRCHSGFCIEYPQISGRRELHLQVMAR